MRSKNYPNLKNQIRLFGVLTLFCGKLVRTGIMDKSQYNHAFDELHHYIKEQEYYNHPERYEGEQKLILLPKQLHADLHSAMSDARFFNKWKIERDLLLYRHRKVDAGFWDSNNEYKEEIIELKAGEE